MAADGYLDTRVKLNSKLTGMIECGQRGEQNTRVHDALAKVGGKDVDEILPFGVLKSERSNQGIAEDHQGGSNADKGDELSPARHDHPSNEAADGSGQRRNRKSGAGGGGRVKQNDLEEQRKIEEVLETQVCQSADHLGGKKGTQERLRIAKLNSKQERSNQAKLKVEIQLRSRVSRGRSNYQQEQLEQKWHDNP